MTRLLEISYWRIVEGREADVTSVANAFKAFCAKNLDATFNWGYVQTGKYVGYCFCAVEWNSGESYGKWQDTYEQNKEYQAWIETVFTKNGPPDYMVEREIIHLVD